MAEAALDLNIRTEGREKDIRIAIGRNSRRVAIGIEKSTTPYEQYTGPYSVDASFYWEKTLETNGKLMTGDVKVNTVPVYDVTNPQGGKTITIGVS